MKLSRIIIGTGNPTKQQRYGKLLSLFAEEVVGLSDAGIMEKPKERGETSEENAEIKARYYAAQVGTPAFAEDEALYVDFFPADQQPGVHVRRIEGRDEVDDATLLRYWEEKISGVPEGQRTGKWHIAYCIAFPNGTVATTALDHPILFFSPSSRVKLPGWPMSSLEGPTRFSKPHSELTGEEQQILDRELDALVLQKLRGLFEKSVRT